MKNGVVKGLKRAYQEGNKTMTDPGMVNLFLNISDNLTEGIFRGDTRVGLIFMNRAFNELFGYKHASSVANLGVSDFCADKLACETLKRKIFRNGAIRNETILFKRKDGSTFWGLTNCTLTRDVYGNKFYDGAIVDITEDKKSEELLKRKNAELNKINAQMDKFLYSASHDMRSPMTSIMGLVNILRMEVDESKHIYLDKIDSSLKKLDHFIKEVNQFSQNTKARVVSDSIDFLQLVDHAWDRVNGERSGIAFSRDVGNEKYFFYSDYNRLLTVFENIFKNSIAFIDGLKENPTLKVHVEIIPEYASIQIKDNGIGIGKSHLEKVFDMFYRASESSKGSGMGLYIVKETLEKIRGEISLSSIVGQETTVTLKILNHPKGKLIARKMRMTNGR